LVLHIFRFSFRIVFAISNFRYRFRSRKSENRDDWLQIDGLQWVAAAVVNKIQWLSNYIWNISPRCFLCFFI